MSFTDPVTTVSERLQLFRQIWLDLNYMYRVLLDSEQIGGLAWNQQAAISSALTDLVMYSHETFQRSDLIESIDLGWSDGITGISANGERLTTRLLFECAATIDQIFAIQGFSAGGDLFAKPLMRAGVDLMNVLFSERYGLPYRIFTGAVNGHPLHSGQALTTLLVLCDFALNPPLPPAVLEPRTLANLTWVSMYPPVRFVRACEMVSELGLVPTEPDNRTICAYIDAVATRLAVVSPTQYSGYLSASQTLHVPEMFNFPNDNVYDPGGNYVTLLAWVQQKLWRLRHTEPRFIVLYGGNFTFQSRDAVELVVGDEAPWFSAPFRWTSSGAFAHSTGLSKKIVTQYFTSIATYLACADLVASCSGLRMDRLPPDSTVAPLWRLVRQLTESLFGDYVWSMEGD